MPLQNPSLQNALSEPKSNFRNADRDDDHEPEGNQSTLDRAWLREQLLAGKNSPLCDPITPAYFDALRARIKQTFANK